MLIIGEGETSRDFCFIENTVQMNILGATASEEENNEVYNVAVGDRTTLNDLFHTLQSVLAENGKPYASKPVCCYFRAGDVRQSQADISKVSSKLGYAPEFRVMYAIAKAMR